MSLSLALVIGILVAGLTNDRVVPVVEAQAGAAHSSVHVAQNGRLASGLIFAHGVAIDGVATDGFFVENIGIDASLVESPCGIAGAGDGVYLFGAYPSGDAPVSLTGAYPSGDAPVSLTGAYPSGDAPASLTGAYPSGKALVTSGSSFVGRDIQVFGGVLQGENIEVTPSGLIKGHNLRVVGAYITAPCSR
jgi:hypothetical protein